jgi:hypothetical protein
VDVTTPPAPGEPEAEAKATDAWSPTGAGRWIELDDPSGAYAQPPAPARPHGPPLPSARPAAAAASRPAGPPRTPPTEPPAFLARSGDGATTPGGPRSHEIPAVRWPSGEVPAMPPYTGDVPADAERQDGGWGDDDESSWNAADRLEAPNGAGAPQPGPGGARR